MQNRINSTKTHLKNSNLKKTENEEIFKKVAIRHHVKCAIYSLYFR